MHVPTVLCVLQKVHRKEADWLWLENIEEGATAGSVVSRVTVGLQSLAELLLHPIRREGGWGQAVNSLSQLSITLWITEKPCAVGSAQA